MASDSYSAVWVSHSSISDFLSCPRAYYLKNVYKDPQTNHKIAIMSPALALGQAVHEVLERLSGVKTELRFQKPLLEEFNQVWRKISGQAGGFMSDEQEAQFKARGESMLRRVTEHPGPLKKLAVKMNTDLPHFWLSEEDGIILCGKIDWLEYDSANDAVTIIDFKTGKQDEKENSLQLPIYYLLATHCQKRQVAGMSYWYLDRQDEPQPQTMPDPVEARHQVLEIAKKIKVARKLNVFKCPSGGCSACRPFEKIIKGEGTLIKTDEMNRDIYILPRGVNNRPEDTIL